VAESEHPVNVIGQNQSGRSEIIGCQMIWTSPDSLRIIRTPERSGKPLKVLLAEDNPIDQICIRRLLEKQGMDVILAGDGRKALDAFAEERFDLVLLDILMPELDGFEVALQIRESEKSCGDHIPVIALTAYSLNAVYDRCRAVGMDGYLSKPVSNSDLIALSTVLLQDSASERG
jgi:CheY-like chemotaxis protein